MAFLTIVVSFGTPSAYFDGYYIRVFYDWYQHVARGHLEQTKQMKSSSVLGWSSQPLLLRAWDVEFYYWIAIIQLPFTGMEQVGQTNRLNRKFKFPP